MWCEHRELICPDGRKAAWTTGTPMADISAFDGDCHEKLNVRYAM